MVKKLFLTFLSCFFLAAAASAHDNYEVHPIFLTLEAAKELQNLDKKAAPSNLYKDFYETRL